MNNYCPIPGASQPKEPMRLIDVVPILKNIELDIMMLHGKADELGESAYAIRCTKDIVKLRYFAQWLKAIPTIDPESLRPTAHWIKCDLIKVEHGECIRYRDAGIKCSKCKHVHDKFAMWDGNFCPGCGSRMIDCEDDEHR